MNMNYINYRKNIHSQNGEDGIIEEIFNRLDISGGYLCEIGACDGIENSNTRYIYEQNANFIPILIESWEDAYIKMIENLSHFPKAFCINKRVYPHSNHRDNLENVIEDLCIDDIHDNFSLLSIDVCSCDYEVWKTFCKFRPKVVIIEINSAYPPEEKVYPCEPTGASAGIMVDLGTDKGYELVCHTGNLIFVVKELYDRLGLEDNDLEKLFNGGWLSLKY